MAFVDEVLIRVSAGNGGNGCISFRREKYVPYGGPNGGNGGLGGSVYLVPSNNKSSLLDFKYQPVFRAQKGQHGLGSDCDGRGGKDLVIQVPIGTVVFDNLTGQILADLTDTETPFLVAEGGEGGRGNKSFATSTLRAPRLATPGEVGESRELRLELRLMADVGLLGMPNAGKSTFLTTISRAKPKIASYPFTTLSPQLGVLPGYRPVVFADLPGLIEGASEGQGLGIQFLKHLQRNRLLFHLIDASEPVEQMEEDIQTIEKELALFDAELASKPRIRVFNKIDQLTPPELEEKKAHFEALCPEIRSFWISNHSKEGLEALITHLESVAKEWDELEALQKEEEKLEREQIETQSSPFVRPPASKSTHQGDALS